MDNSNPLRLIKVGFWLGIGFIVPTIVVYIIGTMVVYLAITPLFHSNTAEAKTEQSNYAEPSFPDFDKTDQVRILEYREVKNGDQLLILGKIQNQGAKPVSSIHLEVELFDASKQLVYECSDYVSRKLKQGDVENFQVKCGCGNQPAPAYQSLTVRVVQASSF